MKKQICLILSICLALLSVTVQPTAVSAVSEQDTAILEQQLDMPIVSIVTTDNISSKENYVDASVSVYTEDGISEIEDAAISIRLRGNSTLNANKKSYKMKFSVKQNLLNIGDGAGKPWNLVSNCYDTSMLRNMTAYELGSMLDGMPYTPNCKSVEVYLNGQYQGVYLLCEAVNINKNRINIAENINEVENNGYLVEMTRYAEENYFDVDLERYEIKSDLSADTAIKAEQEQYISDYITECYHAVQKGNREKIENLIDIDSFVDIYIASEIVKNVDAGWDSFYMFKDSGGKLTFGPMWDFDLALGNFIDVKGFDSWKGLNVYDTANISSNSNPWFCYIVHQEWFRKLVINRWNEKYAELSTLDEFITEEANLHNEGYSHNFTKWNVLGQKVYSEPDEIAKLSTFEQHAAYLSDWVEKRVSWLNEYFNSVDFADGIFPDEDGKEISEDVNIAEYSTKFMMYASDYTIDDTPSFTVRFGSNSWWNMFQNCMTGIMMEKNQKYVLSFDCIATTNTQITYKIQQNYGSYMAYESGSVTANSDLQHFETEFISSVQDANCTLAIEGNGAPGSEISVTNICLKKINEESKQLLGDANLDGEVSVTDAVMLQKWLLCAGTLTCWENADLSKDERIDIFDLCLLKRMIIENMS